MNQPETIRTILEKSKTIAVVGLTDKPDRPSFYVSKYMQQEGYRIILIHPTVTKVLGEKAYPTLDDAYAAEGKIDLVDVFRASSMSPEMVKDVMRLKIPYLWLQEGVGPRSGQVGRGGRHPGGDGPLYLQGTRPLGAGLSGYNISKEPLCLPMPRFRQRALFRNFLC